MGHKIGGREKKNRNLGNRMKRIFKKYFKLILKDCTSLRNDLDEQHKIRMESFEIKMKPIIIRDGPSRKANFKIQAAKLAYEIYSLSQRLRYTTFRTENEEKVKKKIFTHLFLKKLHHFFLFSATRASRKRSSSSS